MTISRKISHPADIFGDVFIEIQERWGRGKDFSLDFVPTLDNKIWGLRRKKMYVVAGRTSHGKSCLMLQSAWACAKQKKKVCFITLEMSREDCLERLISNQCEIDNHLLLTGEIGKPQYQEQYREVMNEFVKELQETKLIFVEGIGRTFKEVNKLVEDMQETPDIVFIDHLNMIKKGSGSKKEAIDEYIMDLRALAVNDDFCVVIAAQINRDVHKLVKKDEDDAEFKCPNLWHLKESGSIEESADCVMIVHFPEQHKGVRGACKYTIRVAKNRMGRTGDFDCIFVPEYSKIKENPYD